MNQPKIKPQTLKGFRDLLPEKMAVRNYVKNILINTFENYGFLPLETPALEYASVLKGKYSGETDEKLGYFFKDNGDREIGLRYDLTVPVAKVLAMYSNEIQLPFKRYQIQPVWRAENTQKGRYREFIQCDIDTFGTTSSMADAEIISLIYSVTQKLGFENAIIKINSRLILSDILNKSGIKDGQNSVLQSLDKIDKIGNDRVKDELISKGLTATQIDQLFDQIKLAQADNQLISIFDQLKSFGVPSSAFIFDPTLVRGCDYYTSTIFEVQVPQANGSIGGGGRYDQLIETLGGPNIPAVGFSFGFERVVDVIEELGLIPKDSQNNTKVLVANLGNETEKEAIDLVNQLRLNNISSVIYPDNEKLGKQIKYALSLNIPYLAIIGTQEAKDNVITLKNLETQEQETVKIDKLYERIR